MIRHIKTSLYIKRKYLKQKSKYLYLYTLKYVLYIFDKKKSESVQKQIELQQLYDIIDDRMNYLS